MAFALVHGWIALVGTVLMPTQAFWDVDLYRWWMWQGLNQGTWPVLDSDWVYPAAAVLPMLLPALVDSVGTQAYALAWTALITALNATAIAVLLRATRPGEPGATPAPAVEPEGGRANRARLRAVLPHDPATGAWWWLAFIALLGPVAIGRLDAVVAPVVVISLAVALRRPAVAAALLTLGAWIKVAPGALLLPLLLVVRRPWRSLVLPAAAVCVVVAGIVVAGGGADHLLSFLFEQGDRGLQLESVGATAWVLRGLVDPSVTIWMNSDITSWEITGTGTETMAAVLGYALPMALAAATGLLLIVRLRAGSLLDVPAFLARGALLIAVLLIVANKVGSPQFIGWLAGPLVVGLARPGARGLRPWLLPGGLVLVIAALTQLVFPLTYSGITAGMVGPSLLLVARNVLLVVLLVVVVRDLVRDGWPRTTTARVSRAAA
ncbi:MAG TPA: glycosyltransferase 87 family protein [Cellulomonas sp.]